MAWEQTILTPSLLQLHKKELVQQPGPELSELQYPEVFSAYLTLVLSFLVFMVASSICLACLSSATLLAKPLQEDAAEDEVFEDSSNSCELEYPKVSVLKQFLDLAEKSPDTVALQTSGGRTLTRHQLVAGASRCAELLAGHKNELVALYLAGPELLVAILGTWLALAAWAPLDKRSPPQRLHEMVKQMQPAAILCDDDAAFLDLNVPIIHAQLLHFDASPAAPAVTYTESLQRVAQVIYTSGSTGRPKGVIYSHERLAHSTHFFAEQCEINGFTRVLQKTPPIWAVFRHEVYPALCRGALVVYPDEDKMADPIHLARVINSCKVSLLISTPTILELLLDTGESMSSLKRAVCMGEPLSWALAARVTDRRVTLMNFYGSTETENTVFAVRRSHRKGFVPAGRPQPHVQVHLLKPGTLEEVDEGEICFGGMMSSGYWQDPELTAACFIDHPSLGKLYRSGDLGTFRGGQLVVLGRQDRQVKIRGARVELQEVEHLLAPLVSECACVAAKGEHHLQIVAFCTSDVVDLQRKAEAFMPPQLLPSLFVAVEQLPRLANGKVALAKLQQLGCEALLKQSTETQPVLDSLGMLQNLTRSQIEEDKWMQNQQAFWCLLVMLEHFLVRHHETPALQQAFWITVDLCHCRDMAAFLMLLGFVDSRSSPGLGAREAAVFLTCIFVVAIYKPCITIALGEWQRLLHVHLTMGYEWFLYVYLWCRLLVVSLKKLPAACQVFFLWLLAIAPDDFFWLLLPLDTRMTLAHQPPFDIKSVKFVFAFLPWCYFLGYHGTKAGFVAWSQRLMRKMMHAGYFDERHLQMSFAVGCWAAFFALTMLGGIYPRLRILEPYTYQHGYQAVFKEIGDHSVSWQYMTTPSLLQFAALWVGEALMLILPCLIVAAGMANCPWHFKTMGTTCFGTYVAHVPLCFTHWMMYPMAPLYLINTGNQLLDICMILAYSIFICLLFAHTLGFAFHHALVGTLKALATIGQSGKS